MQPFKEGAFRIAIDANQTIQPLVVIGAGKLMPPKKAKVYPGVIKIIVGDPIDVSSYQQSNIDDLKSRTFEQLKEMILRHS